MIAFVHTAKQPTGLSRDVWYIYSDTRLKSM